MKRSVKGWGLWVLVAALALVAAACGGDDETAETTPAETAAPTTVAAPTTFDLVAAVDAYAAAIPEGFNAVGDITAFKDAMTAGGVLVIDVREAAEYAEGHIEGAINIPLRP